MYSMCEDVRAVRTVQPKVCLIRILEIHPDKKKIREIKSQTALEISLFSLLDLSDDCSFLVLQQGMQCLESLKQSLHINQ